MATLLPINKIRRTRIQRAIKNTFAAGLDIDVLDDFLASVDWSGVNDKRPGIADDLGQLEAWSADYASGDLTRSQFVARLLTKLPESERNWRLFLEDRPTIITVVHWAGWHPIAPRLERSGDVPQNGSDAPPRTVPVAPNNDIVLVA